MNDPCSCGSGKKYKKCCLLQQSSDQSFSWTDNDGIHFVAPGSPPSPEQLEKWFDNTEKRKLKNY
ncbi:MAG: SEC-C domain-containing protein [Deltaproteobacteria bacterium]|nr:SEC-C domain-containing protein [Deltaproteobacteria bacterium]